MLEISENPPHFVFRIYIFYAVEIRVEGDVCGLHWDVEGFEK